MRAARHGFVVLSLVALLGATAPALLGSSAASTTKAASTSVKKIRASNLYYCAWSKSSCSASDAGHVFKVLVGTKVKWIYEDTYCDSNPLYCHGHDVAFGAKNVSPTVMTDGAVIRAFTYNSVGKFHFWCTHHSTDAKHITGMYGYVRVHT